MSNEAGTKPVRLLASVADPSEAEFACALGADIVDLKDPARGALGAWPEASLRRAVGQIAGRRPVSATVGDLPMDPALLLAAARRTASSGVDIVKIGFFRGGDHRRCAAALAAAAAEGIRLVAVLMADQEPDMALIPWLADAGFFGVMLDTADKRAGSLRRHRAEEDLGRFVATGRRHGLLTGLAGSLAVSDIAPLMVLAPDYLGFRGALCRGGRTARLDAGAFAAVRAAMDAAAGSRSVAHGAQPLVES
ncbi:(5-formylfuran-3-yl)methyl phosphate synthase [Benzoatithermus flavus]|uniref:(5-formylfuran-3-yl)methyl phosphate synthase n=1 Tax=Benzoatithermus flavus TaxID=3108223 RepID=A0ABU8XPN2_9PROT